MITNECIHKKLVIALNHDNYVRNERDGFKSELSMPVGRSARSIVDGVRDLNEVNECIRIHEVKLDMLPAHLLRVIPYWSLKGEKINSCSRK